MPDSSFPTAILLIGPPGCGKSTWIESFQALNPDPDRRILSSDAIAEEYAAADGTDYHVAFQQHADEIFRTLALRLVEAKASGHNFILDQTNARKASRIEKLVGTEGWLKVGVRFEVDGPEDEALLRERLATREAETGKHIREEILEGILHTHQSPEEQPSDEFDIVVTMDMQGRIIVQQAYSDLGRSMLDHFAWPGGASAESIPTVEHIGGNNMSDSLNQPVIGRTGTTENVGTTGPAAARVEEQHGRGTMPPTQPPREQGGQSGPGGRG